MTENAKTQEWVSAWECAARKQSLPEPADCNWPFCGCDPHAARVLEAVSESGFVITPAKSDGIATEDDMRKMLRQRVRAAGGQSALSREIGVPQGTISNCLVSRQLTEDLAYALGFSREKRRGWIYKRRPNVAMLAERAKGSSHD